MREATARALFDGMRHEQERDAPPAGFPPLPLIPVGRYTDPAFLALEQQHLWRKSWLYALHVDELPRAGSFRLWRKTGSPIIIVRGKDDVIRAYYNACRHRGASPAPPRALPRELAQERTELLVLGRDHRAVALCGAVLTDDGARPAL